MVKKLKEMLTSRPPADSPRVDNLLDSQNTPQKIEDIALPDPNVDKLVNLFDKDGLTASIVNKIHSLIMSDEDVTWLPDVEEFSGLTELEIVNYWNMNIEFITELVLELLVRGTVIVEPYYPPSNPFRVTYRFVPVDSNTKIFFRGSTPVAVEYPTTDTDPTTGLEVKSVPVRRAIINLGFGTKDESSVDLPNDLGKVLKERLARIGGETFTGDVFLFRINHRLSEKFGRSIHFKAFEQLNNLVELRRNLVLRARIARSYAWVVKSSRSPLVNLEQTKGEEDRVVAEFSKPRQNNLFSTALIGPKDSIEMVTPPLRALGISEDMRAILQGILAVFEFPPAIFSQPEGTNRSTLEQSKDSYIKTYTNLQKEVADQIILLAQHTIALTNLDRSFLAFKIILPSVFSFNERDKVENVREKLAILSETDFIDEDEKRELGRKELDKSVSYTHLTLPTIYSV